MKKCIKCKEEKELKDFMKCPKSVNGRRNTCKLCANEHSKKYNRERKQEKLENQYYYV